MEQELENLLPSFPGAHGYSDDSAFWAFLILRCHNRKDVPYKVLSSTLHNPDDNTGVKLSRVPYVDFGTSCIPASCFNGLFWHWVPVNEDLSQIDIVFEEKDVGMDCETTQDCPLFAEGACRGQVACPESLTRSDIASWLCWDIIAKLSGAITREVGWHKKGHNGTARCCTYEIPEPYCDQVDPFSVVSEVVSRFGSISRYVSLKAPEIGDPVERRGRKVVPITLRVRLTEEGFATCLEVLKATGPLGEPSVGSEYKQSSPAQSAATPKDALEPGCSNGALVLLICISLWIILILLIPKCSG